MRGQYESSPVNIKPVLWAGGILACLVIGFLTITYVWDSNPAGYTTICQAPMTGTLNVYPRAGAFMQNFGTITRYKQVATISFGSDTAGDDNSEDGSSSAPPVNVRFNDSGRALVYCNARFELPTDDDNMLRIHTQYRSYDHLVDALLEKVTAETMILTAAMFSSEDTYGGGRAEYLRLAEDQLEYGKYQTDVTEISVNDPITSEVRRVKKVIIRKDATGNPLRLENPLAQYGIKVTQLIIDKDLDYEAGILTQIEKQREAYMQTVSARAEATKATQDVLTVEAKGKASVAEARYLQLVEKERATVEAQKLAEVAQIQAEQRLKVAQLDKQAAEETKQQNILLGEGEAARKKAVMEADGALQAKLDAWLQAQQYYSEAMQNYKGNWVPSVVMGANGNTGSGGATDLLNLLMAKTARDLALDISIQSKQQ